MRETANASGSAPGCHASERVVEMRSNVGVPQRHLHDWWPSETFQEAGFRSRLKPTGSRITLYS
jgi:hypothetical protein